MRKVGLILLLIISICSCAKEQFVINTVRLEQACIDNINSIKLFFDISLEDEYEIEVKDNYSLVWNSKLLFADGMYESDTLIIPYQIDNSKLEYKVINQSGNYLDSQININKTEPNIWKIEGNMLIPDKEVNTQITLVYDKESTVLQSDKPLEIKEGIKSVVVEYKYKGIFYKYIMTI